MSFPMTIIISLYSSHACILIFVFHVI